ncbi:MAG: hypothetical protein NTW09_05190 [Candidatus Omnitrophica bacterium]|nr:hypothetical protein [Candidatus Omnitrophota bacterium]
MSIKIRKEHLEMLLLAAVVSAAVSTVFNWYSETAGRQVGSFEYVRKAENLIENGRLQDAIRYLEKAHSSSPENEVIAAQLANTYSLYSDRLARSDKYETAIGSLKRACDVRPCSKTAQALAIMYSKRAISRARGDPAGTKADLENARQAASSSAIASRNLSVSLFNDAVAESKAGKDGIAIVLLKESSLTYKDASFLELLGDIYYKNADFEKARFYFGRALAMSSENAPLKRKFRKVVKEVSLAKTEESRDFAHFELRYDKDLAVDASSVKEILDRCYLDVGGDLKYFPDSKTVVFLYSPSDFRRIFALSPAARAFYDGSIRIPLSEKALTGKQLTSHIYHEYTHAVVYARTGSNCPVWLNEGIAVWEEHKKDPAISYIFARLVDKDNISLAFLHMPFDQGDEKEVRARYLVAYSAVKYIIATSGLAGLNVILSRIKEGLHVINAIEDEFLISEKEFERRWKNYAVRTYLAGR